MRILDKHPAPWRFDGEGKLLDASGDCVMCDDTDAEHSARWLILAAPELLAALKLACEFYHGSDGDVDLREKHLELIARIEDGNG